MHPFESLVVREGTVGIHWFGQSTFGLKDAQGTIVQVDPYYPHERPPTASSMLALRSTRRRYTRILCS